MAMSFRSLFSAVIGASILACTTDPEISRDNGAGPTGPGTDNGATTPNAPPTPDFTFSIPSDRSSFEPATAPRTCGAMKYQLQASTPELVVVLDRSGSMLEKAGAGTRWSEVSGAVQDTVSASDAGILWGLKVFPSGTGRCTVLTDVEVPVGPHTAPIVNPRITAAAPDEMGGTPTAPAVRGAATYLKTLPSKNAKYMVLATDGEPTCANGDTQQKDPTGALAAITEAAQAGIHTFVMGIATLNTKAHQILNMMADAGLEPRTGDPRYFAAADRRELVAALDIITGRVSSCRFPLQAPPPAADKVTVKVSGQTVPADGAGKSGWSYGPDGKSITLHGPWCDQLSKGGGDRVDIVYGCPEMVIP